MLYFNARLPPISPTRMKISIMLFGILTLCVLLQGQENPDGFISINCGASNDYVDYFNIHYETDDGFIDTGENKNVSSEVIGQNKYETAKNLRTFPNGTRNCYTLRPKLGKGNTYLVRAIFWYGDYDGKKQPPVFHLYIDTNYWDTVERTSYTSAEVIYVAQRDHVQVCLVNIGLGVPFISSLELRPFLNFAYKMPSSGALHTFLRYDLGSSVSYRYPQDDYDRIWHGTVYDGWKLVFMNSTSSATPTSDNAYRVPKEVLMTAQETLNGDNLELNWTMKSDNTWYAYFHFAEVQNLVDQLREMDVYVGTVEGGYDKVDMVTLRSQNPSSLVGTMPSRGRNIEIKIEATAQSSLPPLLNALEIFMELQLPNTQTNEDDFNGINNIKTTYGVVEESWQGDPCVPQNMTWEGLNCSYDNNVPRIISLNLSSSNLSGTIAASFSNLTAMTSLDLSKNGLKGPLPAFFAQMPKLKFINLSGNHLNGSIPEELKKRQQDGTIQLSLENNPLCQIESCQPIPIRKKKSIIIPVAVSIASVIGLILLGISVTLWKLDKHKLAFARRSTKSKLKEKNRTFTYTEILRITNNFDTIIGEGGFGKVYLETLDHGVKVAVKMLSLASKQGYNEFEAEAQLLMVVHHRNLVSLVGYCDDTRNIALIYEYMPGGNLREHLSATENNPNALSWIQRLQIAVDAAEGLNYLHHGCNPPIIHRDLKSSNILLNEKMQAKIADFGLSKAFATDTKSYISTRPAGTPGYLDPEFQSSGNLNRKSDVYSFGIILFELITGHSAILRHPKGNTHILHWVTSFIHRGDVESIMDPRLMGQFSINSAWKAAEIAMSCVPAMAIQRPDINIVLQELKECLDVELSSSGISQTSGTYKSSGSHESFRMTTLELDFDSTPSAR